MTAFFIRQWRLVIVLLVLIAWLCAFPAWRDETFGVPLDEPISLSPAGAINTALRVRLEAPHELRLVFSFGSRPRKEAMHLIGSKWWPTNQKPSVPYDVAVPLRWSLTDQSGQVISSGEGDTHGISSHGSADASRSVATLGRLSVDRYRFTAAVLRDVPEFHDMTARLELGLPGGKVSFGWQSDVAIVGAYANILLIIPLVGSLTMIVLGLGVRDWTRARKR